MTKQQKGKTSAGQQRRSARPEQMHASRQHPQKRSSKSSARMRRMRKKRMKNTILLIALLLILVCGAGGLFYMLRGGIGSEPVMAYSTDREFQHQKISGISQRADAFAADLCVVTGDQTLDSVSLEQAQKGVLLDLKDKSVLYAQGAYDKVYPASITKIITALLAFKNSNMDDVVTITQENITLEEGSQVVGFQVGDQVTMDQLVHCLLVYSGNDAASAIATHVGGSTENFVAMMNEYAAQLGCTGTHFTNPHGLQDENHHSWAIFHLRFGWQFFRPGNYQEIFFWLLCTEAFCRELESALYFLVEELPVVRTFWLQSFRNICDIILLHRSCSL